MLFFFKKVNDIIFNLTIDNNVYNGIKKVTSASTPFMSRATILECLKEIKIENCEGYGRIPQRVLVDGAEI